MTLLVLLLVINPYLIIPWWAWTLAVGNGIWTLFAIYVAAKAELLKRKLALQGANFIKDMLGQLDNVPVPPGYSAAPKDTMN